MASPDTNATGTAPADALPRSDGARSWPSACETCQARKELDALRLQLLMAQADIVELLRAQERLLVRLAKLERRHRITTKGG